MMHIFPSMKWVTTILHPCVCVYLSHCGVPDVGDHGVAAILLLQGWCGPGFQDPLSLHTHTHHQQRTIAFSLAQSDQMRSQTVA